MVQSLLLMCLFFHRGPFLSCLVSELAPALCHNISSKLHLQKKGPNEKGGGFDGARGLSAGTELSSTDPGSLAQPQKVSHLFSENWLGPASRFSP